MKITPDSTRVKDSATEVNVPIEAPNFDTQVRVNDYLKMAPDSKRVKNSAPEAQVQNKAPKLDKPIGENNRLKAVSDSERVKCSAPGTHVQSKAPNLDNIEADKSSECINIESHKVCKRARRKAKKV